MERANTSQSVLSSVLAKSRSENNKTQPEGLSAAPLLLQGWDPEPALLPSHSGLSSLADDFGVQ